MEVNSTLTVLTWSVLAFDLLNSVLKSSFYIAREPSWWSHVLNRLQQQQRYLSAGYGLEHVSTVLFLHSLSLTRMQLHRRKLFLLHHL